MGGPRGRMGRSHESSVGLLVVAAENGADICRVEGVSRMVAAGLGLETETFVDAGKYGSHLLAPTATDLDRFGKRDTYVDVCGHWRKLTVQDLCWLPL